VNLNVLNSTNLEDTNNLWAIFNATKAKYDAEVASNAIASYQMVLVTPDAGAADQSITLEVFVKAPVAPLVVNVKEVAVSV